MSAPRRPLPFGPDPMLLLGGGAAVVLAAVGLMWTSVQLADPPGFTGQRNPLVIGLALATGEITWTLLCSLVAAALLVLLGGAVAAVMWAVRRSRTAVRRAEDQARHLADATELAKLAPKGVAASAAKLRPGLAAVAEPDHPDEHGVFLCTTVRGGLELRSSWEDMALDIWGPRRGKTTARAIPAAVAAPGPIILTSRKGDIVDAVREPRMGKGRVWVFDPMDMLEQDQTWWWNPLGALTSITEARRLAENFTFVGEGARSDEFFGPKSHELVANLLLAAAVGGKTILDAYVWSTRPRDDEPARLLRAAGFKLPAQSVEGNIALAEKTRSGIFGGAERALSILTEEATGRWITPQPGLTEFKPHDFVRGRDTLALLSEDGPGAPAPVVAAFVDSTYRAGERAARRSPRRRLDPPLLSILDEAANICRIKNLPNLYSFYGSAGMPIMTILQSFSQGIGVWGREGMQALWSASNVRIIGGGVSDPEFLKAQSELIGEFDEAIDSVSRGRERSVSYSYRRRAILSPADLAALPDGRMIVIPSGSRPTMGRSRGWWDSPHAAAIQASLATWDPDERADDARGRWDPAEAAAFDEQYLSGAAQAA
jgi:PAS domain-containing protein